MKLALLLCVLAAGAAHATEVSEEGGWHIVPEYEPPRAIDHFFYPSVLYGTNMMGFYGTNMMGFYGSQTNYLSFAAGGRAVLTIGPDGAVTWRGHKVKGDAEFRRAMTAVSRAFTNHGCR